VIGSGFGSAHSAGDVRPQAWGPWTQEEWTFQTRQEAESVAAKIRSVDGKWQRRNVIVQQRGGGRANAAAAGSGSVGEATDLFGGAVKQGLAAALRVPGEIAEVVTPAVNPTPEDVVQVAGQDERMNASHGRVIEKSEQGLKDKALEAQQIVEDHVVNALDEHGTDDQKADVLLKRTGYTMLKGAVAGLTSGIEGLMSSIGSSAQKAIDDIFSFVKTNNMLPSKGIDGTMQDLMGVPNKSVGK
jgi:hypothetical protein